MHLLLRSLLLQNLRFECTYALAHDPWIQIIRVDAPINTRHRVDHQMRDLPRSKKRPAHPSVLPKVTTEVTSSLKILRDHLSISHRVPRDAPGCTFCARVVYTLAQILKVFPILQCIGPRSSRCYVAHAWSTFSVSELPPRRPRCHCAHAPSARPAKI